MTGAAAGVYASLLPQYTAGTGPYADAWLQYQRFSASVTGSELPKETYHARGLTGSVEIGYGWSLGGLLTPGSPIRPLENSNSRRSGWE